MKTADDSIREICSVIGRRIRSLRKESGLSLEDLASKTGFAKSYLSQIENRKREPPISTLAKIAWVLKVDLLFLLGGEMQAADQRCLAIVRAGERKPVPGPFADVGYVYESINSNKIDRLMDAYVVTLCPDFPSEPQVHEGQELAHALEGSHEFFYDGTSYLFHEGDSYYYDSNKPHYGRSVGGKTAKLLVVFSSRK